MISHRTPPDPIGRLRLIWAFAVLGGLAQSLAGAAGGLLARDIGGTDLVAGLPATLLTLGAAASAVVIARSTPSLGRTGALRLGAALAAAGCAVVVSGGLVGVLAGHVLVGAGTAAVMLSRYAAAELRPWMSRARSIASVMAMITIGAVVGPNLLAPSAELGEAVGIGGLRGAYVVAGAVFVGAALLLGRPDPSFPPGRRLDVETVSPTSAVTALPGTPPTAVAVLAVANLVMVAVMTMAPMHLRHGGSSLGAIGLLVSAHIAGMFAPAVLSGRLTERLGARRAATVAMVVLVAACVGAASAGTSALALGAAMVVLGVGWNLAVVAGSDLLVAGVPGPVRPRLEGLGELAVGVAAAVGGACSGVVMGTSGYPALAWLGAVPPTALVLALLVRRPAPWSHPDPCDRPARLDAA